MLLIFYEIINTKIFDSNLLKIGKHLYKNVDIYYIGCITMKAFDYVKINSANPLYLIIDKVDGHIEERNGNEYLILASRDKEVLRKYTEHWDENKYLNETVNGGEAGEYEKRINQNQIQLR